MSLDNLLAPPAGRGRPVRFAGDELHLNDWFAGAGGATQGGAIVPGVVPVLAANHDPLAIATHSANFPDVEHFLGEIAALDVATHPYAELFWASPECTTWSPGRGKPVDFDKEPALFGDEPIAEEVARSRALMQDVVRYLEGMVVHQRPVLAGVVENVVDVRKWVLWAVWRGRIERLGYRTRLIALNSMHARSRSAPRAPQSRDRLYLAYWHKSLGRDPDWDKWLRPVAHCPSCDQDVVGVQVWRRPGVDMGRWGKQYDYRCPRVACRGQVLTPSFVPASAAIDWSIPGKRIGDRDRPLAAKTRARIVGGVRRYARPVLLQGSANARHARVLPRDTGALTTLASTVAEGYVVPAMLVPAGGTWNAVAQPVTDPMRTRTTRATEVMVVPPLLVPVEGRDGKQAVGVDGPMRTQTARSETGVMIPVFVTELRGGGSVGHSVDQALSTLTAGGNHHGLVIPPLVMRNNTARGDQGQMSTPASEPLRTITAAGHQSLMTWGSPEPDGSVPTQTTAQGDALLTAAEWDGVVDDCLFRMLEPHEIHRGMAFTPDYVVLGSKRDKVRQLGNAVTPPVAEVLVSALVECISGESMEVAA